MERTTSFDSSAVPSAHDELAASNRLRGRWLRLVRIAWILVTGVAVLIFVASIPAAAIAVNQGAIMHDSRGTLSNNPTATPTQVDIVVTLLSLTVALTSVLVSLILAAHHLLAQIR